MALQPTFFKSQLLTKLPYPSKKFTGQTLIVTGSNVGIGLEAARHFVRLEVSSNQDFSPSLSGIDLIDNSNRPRR